MSDNNRYDGAIWNERVTNAANCAIEQIQAMPIELRGRVLSIVAICFERELKPLPSGRWQSYKRSRNFDRRNDGN